MKVSKKTLINIFLIALVVSFFVTPLGYHGKVFLNSLFSFSPDITTRAESTQIENYNWQLKDPDWNFFSFEQSEGRVVYINFWASWRLPCAAELASIDKLYEKYKGEVDFYIVTNEEREPVEEFMAENKILWKQYFDGKSWGNEIAAEYGIKGIPATFLIGKEGKIVATDLRGPELEIAIRKELGLPELKPEEP